MEKPRVLEDSTLTVGQQQHATAEKKNNIILGGINRNTASRWREAIIPLYLVLIRPHLGYCTQFWDPQYRKDVDKHK